MTPTPAAATPTAPAGATARRPRLSDDLEVLLKAAGSGAMTVRQIEALLRGRGFAMLVVILCVPFLLPVSVPGVSTVFGLSIAMIGLRLALGQTPWLPRALLDREIPAGALQKILGAALRGARVVEKLIRPRMRFLDRWPFMLRVSGALVTLDALLLAVPLPGVIPLTNTIPSIGIIALMLGRMERDGVVTLVGYFFTLLSVAYFTALAFYGTLIVGWVRGWFGG